VQSGASHAENDLASLRATYVSALLQGDRRAALKLLREQGVERGASVAALSSEVVQAAQHEIGRLWQANAISIAQEHQATAIAQVALAYLYDVAPSAAANGKKVLVACVEGELHDFPARIVADALDLAGFTTRYLGANVPTRSLIERVQSEQPDLVALSVTMAFNLPALRSAVEALRAATRIPIAVGGGACLWSDNAAASVAADLTASSAAELVELVRQRLGVSP
jgi:methanogenic corrinoid protein MtbC1